MLLSKSFTYNQPSHCDRKTVNHGFETNDKQITKMRKVGKTVKLKNCVRYIKPPLEIYADFESNLVPVNNGKRNLDEIYTNKYQNHVA